MEYRYQLVCEGSCNPGVTDLDLAIRRFRAAMQSRADPTQRIELIGDATLARLHALRHTPHLMTTQVLAVCTVCGHGRRYGQIEAPKRRDTGSRSVFSR